MDFTADQWMILTLVLLLGWVLGALSMSGGGRRWRRTLDDERAAHEAARRTYEARIAELERNRPAA